MLIPAYRGLKTNLAGRDIPAASLTGSVIGHNDTAAQELELQVQAADNASPPPSVPLKVSMLHLTRYHGDTAAGSLYCHNCWHCETAFAPSPLQFYFQHQLQWLNLVVSEQ